VICSGRKTLQRNNNLCCVPGCRLVAVDAHHILNRNLFTGPSEQGGYFVENGAQLCSQHHYEAELTLLSVEDIRTWCNITEPVIPSILDPALEYDCWGNIINSLTSKTPGLLFNDEGCQKALKKAGLLWQFSQWS
jgi:hypothetical protein